jgi:hypothetical protein
MAIATSNLDSGAPAQSTSFSTNSVTNTSAALLMMNVYYFNFSETVSITSVTGLGLTWTKVNSEDGGTNLTIETWSALGASSTGAVTVNFNIATAGNYVLDQITGVKTSPVVQSAVNAATTSPLSITLSTLQAGSASYGVILVDYPGSPPYVPTPGSGYTQVGIENPNSGRTVQTIVNLSGSTTVNWTDGNSPDILNGIGFEIAALQVPAIVDGPTNLPRRGMVSIIGY